MLIIWARHVSYVYLLQGENGCMYAQQWCYRLRVTMILDMPCVRRLPAKFPSDTISNTLRRLQKVSQGTSMASRPYGQVRARLFLPALLHCKHIRAKSGLCKLGESAIMHTLSVTLQYSAQWCSIHLDRPNNNVVRDLSIDDQNKMFMHGCGPSHPLVLLFAI